MKTLTDKVQELLDLIEGTGTELEIKDTERCAYSYITVKDELADELLKEKGLIRKLIPYNKTCLVYKLFGNIRIGTIMTITEAEQLREELKK